MSKNNKITNFFKKTQNQEVSDSDEDESDCSLEVSEIDRDLADYEKLLLTKADIKKKTKIVLVKKTAGGSAVWDFFGQLVIGNKQILTKYHVCKLCYEITPMRLKGFGVTTSTSNLSNHLRTSHNVEICSKNADSTSSKTKNILSGKSSFLNRPDTQKFANARLLVQMCCRDLRPFNMVEQPGFVDYIQSIKPNIQMPAATTLSRTALTDVYVTYENTIKKFLKNKTPQNISLVLDMWTDSYKRRSYINIRILFCLHFNTVCVTLKTELFPHPHNKYTIANNINETIESFGLEDKQIVTVSDGGSNIVAAMKINNMKRLGCSSHSLHRFIVHDILQNNKFTVFSNTVMKLKRIYKFLNYNTEGILKIQKNFEDNELFNILSEATNIHSFIEAEEQFQFLDEDIEIDENLLKGKSLGTLKNSNDTRWNTLCKMFKSFSLNQKVVNIALVEIGKTELALNQMEKLMMNEFLQFLEIFEDATTHLQGRKYPTITCNIVFHENILDVIQERSDQATFEECINMYNYAKVQFPIRFKILKIHVVAALLDPIQKSWPRLDKWLKKINNDTDLYEELTSNDCDGGISRKNLILSEIKKLKICVADNDVEEIPTSSKTAKKTKLDSNSSRRSIACFVAATSAVEQVDPLEKEVQKYFSATYDDSDTFTWWQNNEKEYPKVARLAESILSIPSTSASAEEAFSSAGSLVTAKRSNLNALTIKQVLFVHDNYELVQKLIKD